MKSFYFIYSTIAIRTYVREPWSHKNAHSIRVTTTTIDIQCFVFYKLGSILSLYFLLDSISRKRSNAAFKKVQQTGGSLTLAYIKICVIDSKTIAEYHYDGNKMLITGSGKTLGDYIETVDI